MHIKSEGNIFAGVRILCVDDNMDNRHLLNIVLTRRGASVTSCASAEDAIEILVKERFDVVVSDISMPPGLDGYDLVHALREMEVQDPLRRPTPTVAVSGEALRPSRKRRFADFQVYLQKPVDSTRLVYNLDRLLEAEGEAVKLGSLGIWEAKQATAVAEVATDAAATATAAAVESTAAAVEATAAAVEATAAAANGRNAASAAEKSAAAASAMAPR